MKMMRKSLVLIASMLIGNTTLCSGKSTSIPKQSSPMTFLRQHALGFVFGAVFYNMGMVQNLPYTPAIGGAAFVIGEGARYYVERNSKEGKYWRKVGGAVVGILASGCMWATGFKSALNSPTINSFITQCDKIPMPILGSLPNSPILLNWNKSYHLGATGVSLVGIATIDFAGKRMPNYNKPGFWIDGIVGQTIDEHFLD